jgi:antitoxin component of RelBE/YafQ-DinJ toxin-antitoxin module
MAQVQMATRIDERVKRAVEEVCAERGLKMGRFIEDALIDKLEELADLEDLQKIRAEPTRSLEEVIKELGLDGEI